MAQLVLAFSNPNVADAFAKHMNSYPKLNVTRTNVTAPAVQILSNEDLDVLLDVLDAIKPAALLVTAQR